MKKGESMQYAQKVGAALLGLLLPFLASPTPLAAETLRVLQGSVSAPL
jgi:hypothetical protein